MGQIVEVSVKILVGLLKHYAEKALGEEVTDLLVKPALDAAEKLGLGQLDTWLSRPETTKQLLFAAEGAEAAFAASSADARLRSGALSALLTDDTDLRGAVDRLPKAGDDDELRTAIVRALAHGFPAVPREEIDEAATQYLRCLRRALLPLKATGPAIVGQAILRVEDALGRVEEKVDSIAARLDADSLAKLRAHVIDASDHIADKTEGFVGRRFVFDALDRFLREHDRGYFVVRGDPGLGKTAIAAQLVRQRGYVHHFNIATEAVTSIRLFVQNVAAQLILRYRLFDLVPTVEGAEDTVLLKSVLAAAVVAAGEPVIVVIDALDEADPPKNPRANPLHLPRSLAPRCFVIATTRRTEAGLDLDAEHVQVLELEADSAGNLADVGAYIAASLARPAMAEKARAWPGGPGAFAAELQIKSEGNFMYLRHVLPAIERGEFQPGHQPLPLGLAGYYRQHWEMMRGDDLERFVRVNQKVIAIIATARQPVTVEFVARVTKLTTTEVAWTLGRWREFLHVLPGSSGERYRLYHASYRDFLAQQVG